jgi:methylglutaconyl-CoA hydratase
MTVKISNHSINSYTWQNWHIFRPERLNALGTTITKELADTLEFARDQLAPEVRAVVLTAETVVKSGSAYWIAGGDLKELSTLDQKHQARIYAQTMRRFCEGLETLPVPVITVVDGAAIGGGAELALAGDIRLATVRSTLEFKQLKLGLATGYGSASRLVNLLGKSKAQALLYFCASIDAETAHRDGLIHNLISSATTEEIAQQILPILELNPKALAAQKKMLRLASSQPSGNQDWADEIFESIWLNDTHAKNLSEFKARR